MRARGRMSLRESIVASWRTLAARHLLRANEFVSTSSRFHVTLAAIRPLGMRSPDFLHTRRSGMTRQAIASQLERVRNWRRDVIPRGASKLRPRQRLEARRRIFPQHAARRVALPTPRTRVHARKRRREKSRIADVTLETLPHFRVRSHRHVRAESLRVSTSLVAGFASTSERLCGSETVWYAGRSAWIRTKVSIRGQCARVRAAPSLRHRIDRQVRELCAEHSSLTRDRFILTHVCHERTRFRQVIVSD
jgi:hypothetical protein